MLRAEILSTGDEICSGAVADTNATHIARELVSAGLAVTRHGCVGDELGQIRSALAGMGRRADVAVITGGLGPTPDDRTAEAAAQAAGVELEVDPQALASMQTFFDQRQRLFSESNRKQALLPRGAACIPNPVGTAPGFILEIGRCKCFFLPGVPREMRHLLSEAVLPALYRLVPNGAGPPQQLLITTFGLTEAAVGEALTDFPAAFPEISWGLRAVFPEIHIRLRLPADAPGRQRPSAVDAAAWIRRRLGVRVLSTEGRSMAEVVGELLRQRGATVAVAESCTGGLVAHLLTDVPGSSDYFLFAGVTYANSTKIRVLGVSMPIIEKCGAVHEDTARQMAEGARRLADAEFGLSTTGIAGPGGETPGKPVGTVCIGIADAYGSQGRRLQFTFGDRRLNKRIFAVTALDLLRRRLLNTEAGSVSSF
jgi:nicotinamide-nucleotide amidase